MNSEEIKQSYSMKEILNRYGLVPSRAGFVCCPFHKEKTPSMKIYKDSFHCFGCGASGDVFSFVEKMDNLSFKEAYLSLGGEYQHQTIESRNFSGRHKQQMAIDERAKAKLRAKEKIIKRKEASFWIEVYKFIKSRSEPLSDEWCKAVNKIEYYFYLYDEVYGD